VVVMLAGAHAIDPPPSMRRPNFQRHESPSPHPEDTRICRMGLRGRMERDGRGMEVHESGVWRVACHGSAGAGDVCVCYLCCHCAHELSTPVHQIILHVVMGRCNPFDGCIVSSE